jgi:hypothetical protein
MNIRTICGVLVLGLVAASAPSTLLLAQSDNKGVSAPKEPGTIAPGATTPNTNMNPTKHRYWRHRGGKHPHYGSRPVRT